jgi:hypothetical protein
MISLVNTRLQPGEYLASCSVNRFNGFRQIVLLPILSGWAHPRRDEKNR